MVDEIRIYVEGGGDGAYGKAQIRVGFGQFLRDPAAQARNKRIRWSVIACGSRNDTFDDFKEALRTHPDAFNVLLVDSEGSVAVGLPPWQHLLRRPGDWWLRPDGYSDEQCHLMVQTMESWFVADIDALNRFYGHGFHRSRLLGNPKVEEIDRHTLASNLRDATRGTSKGEYHKIQHARKLLETVDVNKVCRAAPHCRRLFEVLNRKIDE